MQTDRVQVLSANPVMESVSLHQYVVCVPEGTSGSKNVAAWADTIHKQEQAKNPNDEYKGIVMQLSLSDNRWCFLGSFSDRTIAQIQLHPQVSSTTRTPGN